MKISTNYTFFDKNLIPCHIFKKYISARIGKTYHMVYELSEVKPIYENLNVFEIQRH